MENSGTFSNHTLLYTGIVCAYVLVMLCIGYWCMKRTHNVGDFFLGNRSLGPWMSAFAYGTSYFSAVIFIGYAGKLGWGFGVQTLWIVVGNTLIGTVLAWLVLAKRTRVMTARLNAMTMPEFMAERYGSKPMKVLSGITIFCLLVPYSASVYMGLSYLFQKTMGLGYSDALIFLALLTGVYLVMGGYFAVAVSDFIRGLVEFLGVMLMVYLLIHMKGGLATTFHQLCAPVNMPDLFTPDGALKSAADSGGLFAGWLILVSLVFITSFGPWALPQMVQKFYSMKDERDVLRIVFIAGTLSLILSFGAYYTGALTHLFFPSAEDLAPIMTETGKLNLDILIPHFIVTYVPAWLVLLILLLVFSASMSSLSSLVLVSSSAIAIDIYGTFSTLEQPKKEKRTMLYMRLLCALFVLVSLLLALVKINFIVNLMVIAWGALGGAFLAPYVYGLFWKRTTKAGAYAGMISGLGISIVLFIKWGSPGIPVAGAISMIVPMIVVPVVSLMTPAPDQKLIDKAFGGK
ncbi:MAG: sodium:solute symporter family protein [Verrucomicrobia bacterium]|nr:sodium:solute symporter family protein [Verrucomicrobiota bacterium]